MDTELYLQRIEQYETGTMSAIERTAFESELATNDALREVHGLFLQSNTVIEQGIENNLRAQLQEWAGTTTEVPLATSQKVARKTVFMPSTWVRMAIAASVALLIGWFGWQWAGNQYSDQALFAGNYEKPSESAFRAGTNSVHPLKQGFDALKSGDLNTAATFFQAIPADSDRYAEAQYFLGHAALQSTQYDTAIAAFRQCAASGDARFKEKSEWNLLLTYIAAGRTKASEFNLLLENVTGNPAHSYHVQGKQLQAQLKSIWRKSSQ